MSSKTLIREFKKKIKLNPFTLSGNLYPLIDNGYGEMIEDKNGTPVPKTYTNPVRISLRKSWIMAKNLNGTPISIQAYDYFMISDNETVVDERLEFTFNNTVLKVTQRKELRKLNTLKGYEYELKNLTEGNSYA